MRSSGKARKGSENRPGKRLRQNRLQGRKGVRETVSEIVRKYLLNSYIKQVIMKTTENKTLSFFSKGFTKVPNEILGKVYSEQPCARMYGFLYLCLLYHASFRDRDAMINAQTVPCRRGEWVTSYRIIEQKTNISRSCLRELLETLVEDGVISIRRFSRFTVITIIGYDSWFKIPVSSTPAPAGPPSPLRQGEVFIPVYTRLMEN